MVALDTSIDHDLEVEGLARELVRSIQDARKSAGLEISDRITLAVTGTELVEQAVNKFQEYILAETLAVELSEEIKDGFTTSKSLGNDSWDIALKKV